MKIVRAMRGLATVIAVWLCGSSNVLAQSQDWLVLPTTADDETAWMTPTVSSLSRELRAQGVGVWRSRAAAAAFERRGSSAPAEVTDAEVDAWSDAAVQALRKLAMGDKATALAELEEAQAFSREALETLNRDPARAQSVLDTCLFLIRARMATGDASSADAQAVECARMVPSGEPSPMMHPPYVVEAYERANASAKRTSALLVESDPPGCALWLNGVRVGETPAELNDLLPGRYRVQLECEPGRFGRVHRVDVSPRGANVFIFDPFDRAVRTTPVPHLAYDEPPSSAKSVADARQFGRALPAPVVILASRVGDDALELRAVGTTQVEATLVRLPMTDEGPSRDTVPRAVSALLAGNCKSLDGENEVRIDCVTGAPLEPVAAAAPAVGRERTRVRPPRGQYIAGVTMASTGAVSLVTSYGLVIARRVAGEDWLGSPTSLDAQRKWLNLGTGVLVTGATGAGLLVAGMPLALPYRPKTPWWAWLSGGLGVAAAAGAIASGVTADPEPAQSCSVSGPDPSPCVARGRDIDRAFILGMTAAPLLTMPLVYLLRSDEKKVGADLAPVLAASRSGGFVGVGGSF